MDDNMIALCCRCDDRLQAMPQQEDCPGQMNDAAIMPTACTAAFCLRGNHASARALLKPYGSIPPMVSTSRWRRRLHRSKDILLVLCNLFAHPWHTRHTAAVSGMDSLPLAGCDPMRMRRAKRDSTEDGRGSQASQRRSVYGGKSPLMVTHEGQPVAGCLTPGGLGEVDALQS